MGITAAGRRRNRSWPDALKREIVAASFAPGSSVSMVARHYDVNTNQVFSWRKLYRDEPLDHLTDRRSYLNALLLCHILSQPRMFKC